MLLPALEGEWVGRVQRWPGGHQMIPPRAESSPDAAGGDAGLPGRLAGAPDTLHLNVTGKNKTLPEAQGGLEAGHSSLHPAPPSPGPPSARSQLSEPAAKPPADPCGLCTGKPPSRDPALLTPELSAGIGASCSRSQFVTGGCLPSRPRGSCPGPVQHQPWPSRAG